MTKSLGEKLQENIINAELKKKDAANQRLEYERNEIRSFYESIIPEIIRMIDGGIIPGPILIPHQEASGPWNSSKWVERRIYDFREHNHPHKDTINEIFKWANDNDLRAAFFYQKCNMFPDGVYYLNFEPK